MAARMRASTRSGFCGRATEQAGMQIAVGAGEPHLLVHETAQGRRHHRVDGSTAGVADRAPVELELVGWSFSRNRTGGSSRTPPRLDHIVIGQRQLPGHRLERAAGLDEVMTCPLSSQAPRWQRWPCASRRVRQASDRIAGRGGTARRLPLRLAAANSTGDNLHVV